MTQSEKVRQKRLKALERTSSADLEALLLLDFQSQETGETEMDEILRAAEILAARQHRQGDGGADRAWAEFLEKYRPFAGGSSLYESAEAPSASAVAVQPRPAPSPSLRRRMRRLARQARHPIWYRLLRTAACLALCLLLSGGLLLTFSPEARAAFSGWVREICGDHLEYRYASSDEAAGTDNQAVIYRPAWVPEGCRLTNISDQGASVSLLYETANGYGLVFQYFPTSSGAFSIYMEGPSETVTVRGNPADLYLSPVEGNTNGLVWGDTEAELLMSIFADLPREDLLRIAESIRPVSGEQPPNRPLWFPDSYTLLNSGDGISRIGILCTNDDGGRLCYTYATAGSADREKSWAEITEAAAGLVAEEVLINGLPAQLYRQPDGTGHLVWTNPFGDLYWISGPLTAQEFIQMAESVIMGS